jgi:hypothetical protein
LIAAKAQKPGHSREKSRQCQGGPCPLKRLLTNPQGLLLLRRRVGSHCRNTQTSGNNKVEAKQEKSGRLGGYIEAQSLPRGDFRGDQNAKRENKRQEAERGTAKLASQHRSLPQKFCLSGNFEKINAPHRGRRALSAAAFDQNIFPSI